jgi:hypothetical protein
MRRVFTLALGLGAGATAAILVSRWMRKQRQAVAQAVSPANLGRQIAEGGKDLGSLMRAAAADFRAGMAEREAEIRSAIPE